MLRNGGIPEIAILIWAMMIHHGSWLWVPDFKATACNGMQRNMNDSTLHRHSGTEL